MGPDWANYFDFVISNCKKPLWFKTCQPFFEFNKMNPNGKGRKLCSLDDWLIQAPPKFLSEGSAGLLTKFLQKTFGKEDVKVCHFGDHILNDIYATWAFD